jgi:hypothetical protein
VIEVVTYCFTRRRFDELQTMACGVLVNDATRTLTVLPFGALFHTVEVAVSWSRIVLADRPGIFTRTL